MSDSNDKLYIIVIIGMIFFFIYWYQTRLDAKKIDSDVCKICLKTLKTTNSKTANSKTANSKRTKKKELKNNPSKQKVRNNIYNQKQKIIEKTKKNVRFNHEEQKDNDDISLDSLETSDKVDNNTTKDEDDDNSTNISLKM